MGQFSPMIHTILGCVNKVRQDISEPNLPSFCVFYNFKSLINKPTCYKNPDNPSCIDLILTNCPNYFQNSSTFETGLSDFHKLILTLFKSEIPQQRPNIISYRIYKRFDGQIFKSVISKKIEENMSMDFEAFKCTIVDTLDKYAPLKKKYLRANHSNFVTEELSKAIMNRSRLRNQFLKNRSVESRMKYNKQRNICVALLEKTKRKYYEALKLSDVNDNKNFWKTVKSLFGNKIKCKSQITLVEGNNLVTDDKVLAETFNKFFVNVVATLGIKVEKLPSNYDDRDYNLDELIIRYNDHSSILAIKNKCTELNSTFTFKKVDKEQIFTAITPFFLIKNPFLTFAPKIV